MAPTEQSIPVPMRDPGFRRLLDLYELRDWARDTMCHRPAPAEADLLRRLDDAIVELESEPLVADRGFESVTHCPDGHVGTHLLVGRAQSGDHRYVERRCCRPACRVTWFEHE